MPKAKAQNGKIVCNSCVASYNNALKGKARTSNITNLTVTAKRIDSL